MERKREEDAHVREKKAKPLMGLTHPRRKTLTHSPGLCFLNVQTPSLGPPSQHCDIEVLGLNMSFGGANPSFK